LESSFRDGCHAVGDGDRGQAGAISEFTTYCISVNFDLNGRKMIAWIP
jgi:hypothetical protein